MESSLQNTSVILHSSTQYTSLHDRRLASLSWLCFFHLTFDLPLSYHVRARSMLHTSCWSLWWYLGFISSPTFSPCTHCPKSVWNLIRNWHYSPSDTKRVITRTHGVLKSQETFGIPLSQWPITQMSTTLLTLERKTHWTADVWNRPLLPNC